MVQKINYIYNNLGTMKKPFAEQVFIEELKKIKSTWGFTASSVPVFVFPNAIETQVFFNKDKQ